MTVVFCCLLTIIYVMLPIIERAKFNFNFLLYDWNSGCKI